MEKDLTRPPYISGIYLNGLKMTDDDTVDGKGALTSDPETGYSKVLISYRDNNLLVIISMPPPSSLLRFTSLW